MSGSTGFDPSKLWAFITGGAGSGGAMAAPGMTDAGYTLAPGLTQATSDPAASAMGGGASSASLAKALGDLGKSAGGGQQAQQPQRAGAPQLGQAPLGQPRAAVSLTPLLQLLAQRRNALMPGSATSGQPQGAQPTVGLLGF